MRAFPMLYIPFSINASSIRDSAMRPRERRRYCSQQPVGGCSYISVSGPIAIKRSSNQHPAARPSGPAGALDSPQYADLPPSQYSKPPPWSPRPAGKITPYVRSHRVPAVGRRQPAEQHPRPIAGTTSKRDACLSPCCYGTLIHLALR
ncbi:hypothetical protein P171DRAFT_209097 [Karstenula rhodostoma CBS 690.94]|uniref:Uncharacterized protein n=1 Tax=Karstenula rhodostoma CBS 690.94 TaxID=1392251 RepID=A0A9P4PSN4_9PLEO|nr:hypothetical protein P171DRAFT_209097 [Karstenula rhodostoma CBS 690.94]